MRGRALFIGLLVATVLSGGEKKKSPTRSTENDLVEITATLLVYPEEVHEALGSDLGGHYILANVRLVPKDGRKVAISLDDFTLRTDKDGEKTTPFAPSQIAGRGALVVTTSEGSSKGGLMVGLGGIGGGGGGTDLSETHATMKSGAKEKPDPLLDVLKQKVLPEKQTEAPASGFLYFPMEKQKLKDLELIYKTPEGKLSLRFK
jgi:hypothetical protein